MAGKLSIKCDECGKQFQVPDRMAGKRARCPCGKIIPVPADAGAEAEAPRKTSAIDQSSTEEERKKTVPNGSKYW